MKPYSNGEHVVILTDKVFNAIYKKMGYLEVESSMYDHFELMNMSFTDVYNLYQNETLVANRPLNVLVKT
ncbi:hypothetical protein V7122_21705 [Bacillus sp. JJ1532]|uniref:hypothetical protein n=1 Tax=Bacillus sp. JJ1532 TaxID=3122958 RepID=UPI002FFDF219